jgi:hypothetical protein
MPVRSEDFQYVKISKINKPPKEEGSYMVMNDRYWEVKDGCVAFYCYTSPQCNEDKSLMERLASPTRMNHSIRFIKRVYIPLDYNGVYNIKHIMGCPSNES